MLYDSKNTYNLLIFKNLFLTQCILLIKIMVFYFHSACTFIYCLQNLFIYHFFSPFLQSLENTYNIIIWMLLGIFNFNHNNICIYATLQSYDVLTHCWSFVQSLFHLSIKSKCEKNSILFCVQPAMVQFIVCFL